MTGMEVEDNEYVYSELIGVSDGEFAELVRLGQIGTTTRRSPMMSDTAHADPHA